MLHSTPIDQEADTEYLSKYNHLKFLIKIRQKFDLALANVHVDVNY